MIHPMKSRRFFIMMGAALVFTMAMVVAFEEERKARHNNIDTPAILLEQSKTEF
jgi:hypothetical protein